MAKIPPGSRRDSHDQYLDKGPPWKRVVFLVLLATLAYRWYEGLLDRFLPMCVQSTKVLGKFAPEKAASKGPQTSTAQAS